MKNPPSPRCARASGGRAGATLAFVLLAAALAAGCGAGRDVDGGDGDAGEGAAADARDLASGDDLPGEEAVCVDGDRDGRGPGCAAGADCDDADPAHWNDCDDCATRHGEGCACIAGESYRCYDGPAATRGVGACEDGDRFCVGGQLGRCEGQELPAPQELCGDGVDNDCNGAGDEEAESPCGDCDLTCDSEGAVEPDPADPGAEGVVPNPDGPGVVLGSSTIDAGYAWVANAGEGTVSKLELRSGAEAARYRVGLWGTADDSPSRTAVDSLGNAYVANRAIGNAARNQPSVTKMAGDRKFCVDRSGNGAIETSTGPAALPHGADECVLWTVPVGAPGGVARALAIDFGDPADPLSPGTLHETPVGSGPYTYSDFTGYQRLIMIDKGTWYHAFHRCNDRPEDRWGDLLWDIDTPSDSKVTIYGYSAATEETLLDADPVLLATIPPDAPPVDIAARFAGAGATLHPWLGVLVVIEPSTDTRSPVVRSVEVRWHCHNLG